MNKKEISEIRKQLTIRNCCIERICGCYVDAEKDVRSRWRQCFLTLPEDEAIKYLDIFGKALHGGLGKDLVNMGIRAAADSGADILREMRDTQISEDAVMERYHEYIISNLDYLGQYAVITAYGNYDIPGRTEDGQELADASEEVYEFILSCICPVNLQKPGLVYDPERGSFTPLDTGRMLSAPAAGILYPSISGRSQDMDGALCYVHGMRDEERRLMERLTGSRTKLSDKEERAAYMGIIETVLGQHTTMDEVRRVEANLQRLKERHAEDLEQYSLSKDDLERLLLDSGIGEARIRNLEGAYAAEAGKEERLTLDNLGNLRAFTVEMEEGKLELDPTRAHLAEIRELEGRKVLTVPLNGIVEVNGIMIDIGDLEGQA